MQTETDLLIIGAGPFGLAMAAYARHWRLNYRVVGKPMEFWQQNMPRGMYLRSACDWHLDPVGNHSIESFLNTQARTPAQVEPLSVELYLQYAQWFQQREAIESLGVYVRRLDYSGRRFRATTEDDHVINAGRVVIAVGFKYFKHLPIELTDHFSKRRISHTCDLVSFTKLRGKRCLILGGRQSSFEWAALIREAGAAVVHVCYRHDTPAFQTADWSWATRLVDLIAKDPAWFRRLSAAQREEVNYSLWAEGRLKLEPWLEPRVRNETIKLWPRSKVAGCIEQSDGALAVKLDNGETIVVDQVIAATGYKVDIARVPFLAAGNLLKNLTVRNGFPELDVQFQTNIPGLFMTSIPAVQDFGPFWGFTVAARTSAQIIGQALLARAEAA
jgi:thioredoxin reductase